MSRRGTRDEQVVSDDVLRKLLVQIERQVKVSQAERMGEVVDTRIGHMRKRGSRRVAKGQVEAGEAQVRGRCVAEHLLKWHSPPGADYLAVYSLKLSPLLLA
jgi:hypothetical protein